jgi:hypothetical protein
MFNKEVMTPYPVPSSEIIFKELRAKGDLNINYIGFPFTGKLVTQFKLRRGQTHV